ncbi:Crp/Fnr family transcriptional regulator [Paenibacillus sp. TRM 82003]|nr:Crp/Fnr family transcriptional regulator [Paenibacillus sp. TRM 82003]
MKEIRDRESLERYILAHELAPVFPEALKPHMTLCRFEPGESICVQGGASSDLFVMVQGKIKIYHTSPEGRTLVINFLSPPEVIGDIEYVRRIDFLNTVEAVSSVWMIRISYRRLSEVANDHAPMLRFLLDGITKKFISKSHAMRSQLLHPVEVRLAGYLLSVSFDESDASFRGRVPTAELPDLANLLGASYRHLNRVIRKFVEEGAVERTKSWIVVTDRDALRQYAEEEGS